MSNPARVLILDTYYPDFIKSWVEADIPYDEELKRVLSVMFGTGDSYSHWLRVLGYETRDVIGNFEALQKKWYKENHIPWNYVGGKDVAFQQIRSFDPDILFLQDLSFFHPDEIAHIREEYHVNLVAAQCSCPWPGDDRVKMCDVIFTSFPHYVEKIQALGVRGEYSRLAFDPRILGMLPSKERRYPISFIGGVGYPSHWKAGLEMLETVADHVPEFSWFGYGVETLPDSYKLKKRYISQAWGLRMYELLADYKIILNRHGEVALNYANNMKMYETTGMGALLLTDHKSNLAEIFEPNKECVSYTSAEHAADLARFFLENPEKARRIADAGQERCLSEHNYYNKMLRISSVLKEML
jgi:spore maturation protein CgeB